MDRIDAVPAPAPPAPPVPDAAGGSVRRSPQGVSGGSQSKLSPILFWVVLAAVVFRLVTAATDKDKKPEGTAGLVRWYNHESARSLASATGKPVLYDFTAAWCAPCHRLDAEAWSDDAIAGKVNGRFVPARVIDRQREDGKNPESVQELQSRYNISVFPTLIVADASGREIARSEGFRDRDSISQFLDRGLAPAPAAEPGR